MAIYQVDAAREKPLDLASLTQILYYSAGITWKVRFPDGEFYFRAASSAGALYPIEVYVACGEMPGLSAGVYHFSPGDFSLRQLRQGDYRAVIGDAVTRDSPSSAPATIILSAIFWRSAWKYRARSYRYCFWDSGTITANLLATANTLGFKPQIFMGFIDKVIDDLIGADGENEGSLSLITLGRSGQKAKPREPEPIQHEVGPISKSKVDYPEIRQLHKASSLVSIEEASTWVATPLVHKGESGEGNWFKLEPLPPASAGYMPLGQTIKKRGSARVFAQKPITFQQLSTILVNSTRGIPADFLKRPDASLSDIYFIANAVDGLPSGSYYFSPSKSALLQLKAGEFRNIAGYLGLEQAIPHDASVDVFFLSDLKTALERLGNRGYRAAEYEAAIVGGKMYLCAYALDIGASGLTFYDDDVIEFFSPHAAGKEPMFLVALGHAAYQRKRDQRPKA